jgi:hypothetical protein
MAASSGQGAHTRMPRIWGVLCAEPLQNGQVSAPSRPATNDYALYGAFFLILSDPLYNGQMAVFCCVDGLGSMPLAALSSGPLQQLQVATICSVSAHI